ncbi:hypothetical protein MACH09_01620 [Vibrio sp. MACH09]|uniref:GT-D fold domain-containing glycosyltransferase n=1 Tax=Vibrio sp. MACH09 TaxID=3025122 RepID=UPI002793F519|nr:GT-D fold domain-containing glycosyltransferase [Vibrio sp. MACH09]GLO59654.1 hypothetical protein MACH09_01620 [Vibrio sp. MACH09]
MSIRKISFLGRYPFLRITQFYYNPVSLLNWLKKNLYYRWSNKDYSEYYNDFKFLSPNESLCHLIENNCSLARFNDGEFEQLLGYGEYPPDSDWEQSNSKELIYSMEKVLSSSDGRLLVAITPNWYFLSDNGAELNEPFCRGMWIHTRAILYKYLNKGQAYGDCRMFVPFSSHDFDWNMLRSYLSEKNVIIATGNVEKLSNVSLGKRNFFVECGKINAFEKKNSIVKDIISCMENNKLSKESTIVLASLGPTAGIIALELLGKVVVWDTGHMFKHAKNEV